MLAAIAASTAEVWTAIGTVVTATVAVFAAGFAALQVWELRRTREDQARPFVIVDNQNMESRQLRYPQVVCFGNDRI